MFEDAQWLRGLEKMAVGTADDSDEDDFGVEKKYYPSISIYSSYNIMEWIVDMRPDQQIPIFHTKKGLKLYMDVSVTRCT